MRHLPQGVQLVVGAGVRVLHGDLRAELDMLHDGLPERRIVGHAGRVERRGVEGDEALPLLLGDAQAAVDGDEVGEAEFAGEPVGAAEGFGVRWSTCWGCPAPNSGCRSGSVSALS